MSYTIEYNRKCFRLDAGTVIGDARPLFEATYFLFIQQGDNNVRPRPRTWCMESVGSHGDSWTAASTSWFHAAPRARAPHSPSPSAFASSNWS